MEVGLNLNERLALLPVLPKESNFALLKVIRGLQEKLAPSEEEHNTFDIHDEVFVEGKWLRRKEFVAEGNEIPLDALRRVAWNDKGAEEKNLEFSEKAYEVIKEGLKELDKKKKLTFNHVSLWEKFIGDEK